MDTDWAYNLNKKSQYGKLYICMKGIKYWRLNYASSLESLVFIHTDLMGDLLNCCGVPKWGHEPASILFLAVCNLEVERFRLSKSAILEL